MTVQSVSIRSNQASKCKFFNARTRSQIVSWLYGKSLQLSWAEGQHSSLEGQYALLE